MFGREWRQRLHNIAREVVAVWMGLRDRRVPWPAKGAALLSLLYLVLPLDIIPDFIPVFGWLDDLAIIPLACFLAGKLMPPGLMEELRLRAEMRIRRWGPRLTVGVIAFVLVWIMLASVGGWLALRSLQGGGDSAIHPGSAAELPGHEERERLIRENYSLFGE